MGSFNFYNRIKIGPKLIALFLLVGIIPMAVVAFMSCTQASGAVNTEAENKLSAVGDLKRAQVEDWYSRKFREVEMWGASGDVQQALVEYQAAYEAGGADSAAYTAVDSKWGQYFRDIADKWNYYDFFLIDIDGEVVYSASQEADFGTNLIKGQYKDSPLAEAFGSAAGGKTYLTDFEAYAPSGGEAAAFMAAAVSGPGGEAIGVAAFQLSTEKINAMMQTRTGMGESGETYLVGADFLMRSDSRFETESTLLKKEVRTEGSEAALRGEDDVRVYTDYRGTPVLSAFQPITVEGLNWVMLSEIDKAEVQKPVDSMRNMAIMIVVAAAGIIGGLSFLISRTFSNPIGKMRGALEAVAQGDVTQKVAVTSTDEMGEMAQSYASMQDYLSDMTQAAQHIADGDLTVDVHAKSDKDTLGAAFGKMIVNLRGVMGSVSETVSGVTTAKDQLAQSADQASQASQQVATTTSQLAQGTSQQAASAQEVNQAVEQLSQAIEQVAKGSQTQTRAAEEAGALGTKVAQAADQTASSAQSAAEGARKAAETAQNGAGMVQNTIDGMARIRTTVQAASDEVSKLGERSAEIGKIVAVIEDIAAQTNLLALNAAIEAARAGEQGRGFAVVADEVRQLAERVAKATKEIADLIGGVQTGVDASVKAMADGAKEMDGGAKVAAEAGTALEQILTAVADVNSQIEQIAGASGELKAASNEMESTLTNIRTVVEQNTAASEQMQASAGQVSQSVAAIAGVAEENSSATEEVSASAEEMNAQVEEVTAATHTLGQMADELQQQVAKFRLNGAQSGNGNGKQAPGRTVERTVKAGS
jgi:methyl-accepting chemotaxis protein